LNITWVDKDGKTRNAYEPFDVLTVEEVSRNINSEYRKIGAQRRKTRKLCRLAYEKFGEAFQLLLEFPLGEILDGPDEPDEPDDDEV
jgi:hypothetical protein